METTYAELLRAKGLRVTRPRISVLQALQARPHAVTGDVLSSVRSALPTVSHQAVYDCLSALTDAGLVRRIQPAGSTARYELRVADNHHHLVCRACGSVTDVDCAAGAAPCLEPATDTPDTHGFAVDEAEVIYWGTCADCAATPSSTAESPTATRGSS